MLGSTSAKASLVCLMGFGPLRQDSATKKYYRGTSPDLSEEPWRFKVVIRPFGGKAAPKSKFQVVEWKPREMTALPASTFCGNCRLVGTDGSVEEYECLGHDLVGEMAGRPG